jgi:hypothetical protein
MLIPKLIATVCMTLCGFTLTNSAEITSLPDGTIVPMPMNNYQGTGPQVFGPGITWTSSSSFGVFGWISGFGFGINGSWNGMNMSGTSPSSNTIQFTFNTPVTAVGGFMNYAPGEGIPIISVYDVSNNLIESAALSFTTSPSSVNAGEFHGFRETAPIIKSFTLSNAYIGMTNLTILPAPEPSSFALCGVASAIIAAVGYRRSQLPKTID